ncbi:MAG: hypothetical protein LBV69_02835 [Bacteroidales bacterium]|jgi:hypothetical protein|nr:hypothetical protein [Bacteroidales bacterium]
MNRIFKLANYKSKIINLSLLLLYVFCSINLFAQTSENLIRNVLFSMATNERLLLKNFYSEKVHEKINYAALTYNYETTEFAFILNDSEIQKFKTEENGYFPFNFFHLNLKKESDYGFIYDVDGEIFVNIKGKIIEKTGNPIKFVINDNNFAFFYKKENNYFVNVNGINIGPYAKVYDLKYSKLGDYIFNFIDKKNNSWYVNFNGKILGPYERITGVDISETGQFAFNFKDSEGLYHVNINNKIYGPYQATAYSLKINTANNFAFAYRINNQWLLNISGRVVWNYKDVSFIEEIFLNTKNEYAIKYKQSADYLYSINENSVNLKQYNTFVGEKPNSLFSFDQPENFTISSTNGKHTLKSEIHNNFIEIDNIKYGFSSAVSAYFSEINNSFIWNAVENNELINYELKIR